MERRSDRSAKLSRARCRGENRQDAKHAKAERRQVIGTTLQDLEVTQYGGWFSGSFLLGSANRAFFVLISVSWRSLRLGGSHAAGVIVREAVFHSAGGLAGDRLSVVSGYHSQSHIDPGRNSGRREDVAVLDDVHIIAHRHGGE